MFDVFSSERAIAEFAKKDRSFFEKFVDHIKSIIADIKNIYSKLISMGNNEISAWQSDMEALDKLNNMMLDALAEIEQSETQAQKNTSEEVNNVLFSVKRFTLTEGDIHKNMLLVGSMDNVVDLSGNEFAKGSVGLPDQVDAFFAKYNYSIENPDIGDVEMNRRGAKDSMAHGIGRVKATSFAAVPYTIEKGKIIDYQKNWKGRQYDTIVLAAPISINDKRYYQGVIVIRDVSTQRFYLHEVLTEKESDTSFKTGAGAKHTPGDVSPSLISLLEKVRYVNKNVGNEDIRFSTKRAGDKAKSPDDLTESDVKLFLTQAIEGNLHEGTYFPVRRNTPRILIDSALRENGDDIDNLPVIIQVKKATAHGISPEDMISIIKGMDDPQYIIYQEDNDRYVEVVKYDTSKGSKAVAVLEIGDNKDAPYMNGYKGGSYHTLVTAFKPDKDYVSDTLLGNKNNVTIYKKKGNSQRTSGSTVPSVLNESPFADIIPQNPDDVNAEKSTLEEEISLLSERFDTSEDDIRFSTKRTVANGKKKSYNKNSYYNEFDSLAMRWRNKADTNVNDCKIISRGEDDFSLLKATEDGYVELARGKYKDVRVEYERIYRKAIDELHGNLESIKARQGDDIWNLQSSKNRRNDDRDIRQIGNERFQSNSTRSDEHSGQGDRGESITFSTKRDRSVSEDASNYILDTKEYKEAMKLVDQRYRLTGKKKLDQKAIDRFAGRLLSKSQSQYSREQLTERLSALFDYIANSGNDVSWDSVMEVTANIASDILKQSQSLDRSMAQEYKGTRDWLKGLTVYISPEVRAEIDYRFGSLENFRRKLSGKVKITVTDSTAISLDSVWRQLAEDRPEMFDEATSALDQPEALVDFFDMVKPQYINPYDMDMDEAAYDFALQIYDEYFNIPEIRTEAQKYAQREEMLRGRYNAKIAEIRKGIRKIAHDTLRKRKVRNRRAVIDHYIRM